jgi:hypothetical protein
MAEISMVVTSIDPLAHQACRVTDQSALTIVYQLLRDEG